MKAIKMILIKHFNIISHHFQVHASVQDFIKLSKWAESYSSQNLNLQYKKTLQHLVYYLCPIPCFAIRLNLKWCGLSLV